MVAGIGQSAHGPDSYFHGRSIRHAERQRDLDLYGDGARQRQSGPDAIGDAVDRDRGNTIEDYGFDACRRATDGRSYMQSLQATGGKPGYTWTITSGSLPAGLTLASTGAISGMPTASGTSTFTASVSDSGSPVQTVAAPLTISVAPAPITITASRTGRGYGQEARTPRRCMPAEERPLILGRSRPASYPQGFRSQAPRASSPARRPQVGP